MGKMNHKLNYKFLKIKIQNLFIALALLLPLAARGQFSFTTNNGAITITGYNGPVGRNVVIPASTNGYPVVGIGGNAFYSSSITSVTIPNSIATINARAVRLTSAARPERTRLSAAASPPSQMMSFMAATA